MRYTNAIAMSRSRLIVRGIVLIAVGFLYISLLGAAQIKEPTIEEAYPGLAMGVLKSAKLAKLKKGVVLSAEGTRIEESAVKEILENSKPEIREQLSKNLFFILEQIATQKLLLHEAHKSGHGKDDREDQVIMAYLNEKVSGVTVSGEKLRTFYDQNKETMGGMPFEQVKDAIKDYLLQHKKQSAIATYVQTLGQRIDIQIDAEWVKRQCLLARDNPVDRARSSGKPTMVEFGATGCVPCDMMQPILANLKKKYKDKLNVLFVHVGEEQILGARYSISSIPVQVFFDETGQEVFRHAGFYPQNLIEKKLAAMGLDK
jgi:thiol-disulfide isomerase/thioredoxin